MALWQALAAVAAASRGSILAAAVAPEPTPWPPVFHAVLFRLDQNRSDPSAHTDLYYDWPGGRNLHVNHNTGQPPFYDNERSNGSTFYYTPGGSCKVIDMGVGLLPPTWLRGGHYRGVESVTPKNGGPAKFCHVWDKGDADGNYTGPFIVYYEDNATQLPVRWTFFTGMSFDVVHWIPGGTASEADWQLPAACFPPEGAGAAFPADAHGGRAWSSLRSPAKSTARANATEDVCKGHRCDSGACPCGCECGNAHDAGLCFDPTASAAAGKGLAEYGAILV